MACVPAIKHDDSIPVNSIHNQINNIHIIDKPTHNDSIINESKLGESNDNLFSDRQASHIVDVHVAVVGNVDSGKSTLIGTLISGQQDDGRGKSRSKVFIHAHEHQNGRTSAVSQHIMGFSSQSIPVHQSIPANASSNQKTKAWSNVVHNSKSIITFVDLPGHERYLKTTIGGLTGLYPDYVFVIINSLAGITKMTKEHLGCAIALNLRLVIIVTKIDLVPSNVLDDSKKQIDRVLKSAQAKKLPIHVKTSKDIDTCISNNTSTRICPIFYISSVSGIGLDLLYNYLSLLTPRTNWSANIDKPAEFSIDETFLVSGVGVVVSGTLKSGTLSVGDSMVLGPSDNSNEPWRSVLVRSIHCKRVSVDSISAGNSCALSIRATKSKDVLKRTQIRRGMHLLHPSIVPKASRVFEAEVVVLHHPTTIRLGYQAVVHCNVVRQTASIVYISAEQLRTGDRATCRFRFLMREEYIHTGTIFVFREGNCRAVAKITKTQHEMSADDVTACLNHHDPTLKTRLRLNNQNAAHNDTSNNTHDEEKQQSENNTPKSTVKR